MFAKLLIANRGEIACRIIRTARAMGIDTVAVYSDADARALHVRQADEAVHIGPSPAAESYLRGEKIIAAAKATGAQAIHPGYGFLSENAGFARAVIAAGLIWVGPAPESIEAMGLKDAAKQLMRAAGVPVTPGYDGEDQSVSRLKAEAAAIGYPVLIKAVAGGGGKGMRKVDAAQDFESALQSCKREASSSFGNDEVLLEKWITSPRHIEVQVFGDTHGNVVHLFERDCSLQRRHQKVIEEAPAPGMDEDTRAAICGAAVCAAQAVDYVGAGTIEFIADASEGLRADRIFFMEMNTRLQVEHPVTEEITGVDLVEWQLRVAAGETLPLAQEELSITGHAIEARLYAEDPDRGFLPSIGKLILFESSRRFDDPGFHTGYLGRDEVTPFYDPMLAKLVVHEATRSEAADRLSEWARSFRVWPVKSNAAFIANAVDHPAFRAGSFDTGFIEEQLGALLADPTDKAHLAHEAGHAFAVDSFDFDQEEKPWWALEGFRLNAAARAEIRVVDEAGKISTVNLLQPERLRQRHQNVGFTDGMMNPVRELSFVAGRSYPHVLYVPRGGDSSNAHDGDILAPMPGKVIAVDVAQGQAVEAGQRLLVLEAMKMEHALTAPFAGVVAELSAGEGAQVQVEALLARVEKVEDAEEAEG